MIDLAEIKIIQLLNGARILTHPSGNQVIETPAQRAAFLTDLQNQLLEIQKKIKAENDFDLLFDVQPAEIIK